MTHYEIYVLSVNGFERSFAIDTTDAVITEYGGKMDEECILMLDDTETEQPPVEQIKDGALALDKLKNWETLGALTYFMPGGLVTVGFEMFWKQTAKVNCIKISIPQNSIDRIMPDGIEILNLIAKSLHTRLEADRTIAGWILRYKGFFWKEELERLKRGKIMGEYLIDLRTVKS